MVLVYVYFIGFLFFKVFVVEFLLEGWKDVKN